MPITEREAAQVNSPVGKLLSQLRAYARPVMARHSNGLEGIVMLKPTCAAAAISFSPWSGVTNTTPLPGSVRRADDESQGLHLSSMVAAQRLLRSGCRAKLRIAKQLAQLAQKL